MIAALSLAGFAGIEATYGLYVDDPGYPVEWQYDKNGQPCCIAFIPAGQPTTEPRCTHTQELF